MFITVLHGDNEQTLFNTDCKTITLLDSIKLRCHCASKAEVDLADESGQVRNLLQHRQRYASELLDEREEFILVSVSWPSGSHQPVYTPMLQDEDLLSSRFLAKLGSKGEPRTGGNKTRMKRASQKTTSSVSSSPVESKQSSSPQRLKAAGHPSLRTKHGRKEKQNE
nr:PREDICTED: uncharacterized protein CXorf65-like [Lepisosteus oculatus]